MLDDQVDKEDTFDFDSAGEALGYISLPQAQLLAMQTARETPGDYGNQFSGIPMAFEVVEAEEDEDYYTVTLSLRPQGQFTGTPGQEQYFIEKEGVIAHRQVLSLPEARGGRRFPVVPVAVGLLAVAAVAVVGIVMVGSGSGGGSSSETPVAAGETLPALAASPTPATTTALAVVAPIPTFTHTTPPTFTPTPTPTHTPVPPTSTPAPIPQVIKSGTTAIGYRKLVGFLTRDYTVDVTIRVVNAGAPGVIEAIGTVSWDGESKTKSDKAFMGTGEESEFVFEFLEVGSDDNWTWSADARVLR